MPVGLFRPERPDLNWRQPPLVLEWPIGDDPNAVQHPSAAAAVSASRDAGLQRFGARASGRAGRSLLTSRPVRGFLRRGSHWCEY